jgi:hypothetical protein
VTGKIIVKNTLAFLIVLSVLLCSGCSNPGIIQMSPGVYQLARADHGGIFGNKDALKSGVISDANAYAEREGKVAVPVSAKEHPVGILGDWASYEYTFKIVDKNSPDALTPWILVRSDSFRGGGFTSLGSKDTYYVAKSSVAGEDVTSKPIEGNKLASPVPPSSTTPAIAEPTKSTADRLLELKRLFDAGVLTKEEYDSKKKILVDKL